jgi:hypothetical protein
VKRVHRDEKREWTGGRECGWISISKEEWSEGISRMKDNHQESVFYEKKRKITTNKYNNEIKETKKKKILGTSEKLITDPTGGNIQHQYQQQRQQSLLHQHPSSSLEANLPF